MSNDPPPHEPSFGRKPSVFTKPIQDKEENDLWDLEENISKNPKKEPALEKSSEIQRSEHDHQTTSQNVFSDETDASQEDSPNAPSNQSLFKGSITSLSLLEKISLITIAAIFLISSGLLIFHFTNEIKLQPLTGDELVLPIEGKIFNVSAVETYWRKPIVEGENRDVVRRGVKLIPILKLNIKGTSGAIRILFRDSNGAFVGDSISHAISGAETLSFNATDGFDDLGMHAAYRTGESARWTIQVLEGLSVNAPITEFQTLFETKISADLR